MEDSKNKNTATSTILTPSKEQSPGDKNKLAASHTVKLPGLHARLHKASTQPKFDCNTLPNRLALCLDVSGSMLGYKIEKLREACVAFIGSCNMQDTALAIEPFGDDYPSPNRIALSNIQAILQCIVETLDAHGSTPMDRALDYVLNTYPLTRAVLVSDGQPDHETSVYNVATHFKEASVPIDCVHIDQDICGEVCLQTVAEITGGLYIKFSDINSFAKSFKYLTPRYYAQLTDGTLSQSLIGADEVK